MTTAAEKEALSPAASAAAPPASKKVQTVQGTTSPKVPAGASYFLNVDTKKCGAKVLFNGVQLMDLDSKDDRDTGEMVTIWTKPGQNTVEVIPQLTPDKASGPDCIRVAMQATPKDGDRRTDTVNEVELVWPGSEPIGARRIALSFQVPDDTPCNFWTKVEKVESLSKADTAALTKLTQQVHSAFSEKNTKKLSALTEIRGTSVFECMGRTGKEGITAQVDFYDALLNRRGATAEPLDISSLDLQLLPTGLVKLGRKDGIMTLQLEKMKTGTDLYAGKVDGEWKVVH